jgi:hypothetical protein
MDMTQLLDLETKLSILAANPCHCMVCRQAASLAKKELAEVSPSGAVLMGLMRGTPDFAVAEEIFHEEETARLQAAYDLISRDQCLLTPPPAPVTLTPIPDLPAPEEWRERIEHYRKHAMKPRLRKDSAEPIEHPRIPGSFVFK